MGGNIARNHTHTHKQRAMNKEDHTFTLIYRGNTDNEDAHMRVTARVRSPSPEPGMGAGVAAALESLFAAPLWMLS